MEPYCPSNKISIPGIFLLALYTLPVAPVYGTFAAIVSHYIYLIVIFPFIMGVIAGLFVVAAVKRGKVRNPLVAALFAVVAGLLIYGSFQYDSYYVDHGQMRDQIVQQLQKTVGRADPALADQVVDSILVKETGQPGILGYFIFKAQQGLTVGDLLGEFKVNIGPFFTWLYWLVELLIVAAIPALMAWEEASRPFCETHDRWYNRGERLGGVSEQRATSLLKLLQFGNYTEAGEMLDDNTPVPSAEVYIESCDKCQVSDSRLTVSRFYNYRGRLARQKILEGMISPAQRTDLVRGHNTPRSHEQVT